MRSGFAFALSVAVALAGTGCAGALGNGAALSARSADESVSVGERRDVAAGLVVTKPLEFDRGDHHYIGGIARGLVPATPDQVLAALDDVDALRAMLPRTKRATFVDAEGGARRIELRQGNSVVDATYTVRLAPTGPGELGFRLDPSRPHDIDDVYGYFKVEPYDGTRSLVTVAAAVDVGSGLTVMLFGKRVQDVILSTPGAMKTFFARSEGLPAGSFVAQNDAR
ncbi:MAG TPA: SRPBCC family protein [Polyangiaceae bacterium]|nr:SRPBCC family protein [Polyangiaceae bacterium]